MGQSPIRRRPGLLLGGASAASLSSRNSAFVLGTSTTTLALLASEVIAFSFEVSLDWSRAPNPMSLICVPQQLRGRQVQHLFVFPPDPSEQHHMLLAPKSRLGRRRSGTIAGFGSCCCSRQRVHRLAETMVPRSMKAGDLCSSLPPAYGVVAMLGPCVPRAPTQTQQTGRPLVEAVPTVGLSASVVCLSESFRARRSAGGAGEALNV